MTNPNDQWRAAIRDTGGAIDEHERDSRLRALIHDHHVEVGFTRSANRSMTWLAADAPGAAGLRLAVSRSASHPFHEAFAITTGEPEFDHEFSVQTNDAPFARLWLDAHVRSHIAASRGYHFLLENNRGRAWRFDDESADSEGHDNRVHVLRALIALSERGRVIERIWRELADHLGGRVVMAPGYHGAPYAMSMEVEFGHATVAIDGFFGGLAPRRAGRGLFTRVRCPRHSETRDRYAIHDADGRRDVRPRLTTDARPVRVAHMGFAERYQGECESPERVAERLDQAMCERVLAAGPAAIVAEPEQVTVIFLGFEHDPDRLRQGIAIAENLALEMVALGLASPYR